MGPRVIALLKIHIYTKNSALSLIETHSHPTRMCSINLIFRDGLILLHTRILLYVIYGYKVHLQQGCCTWRHSSFLMLVLIEITLMIEDAQQRTILMTMLIIIVLVVMGETKR